MCLIMAILIGVKWNLIMVFIYISLMTSDTEHSWWNIYLGPLSIF